MRFEKGSVKHLIISIVLTIIFGFIIFPLLDWLLALFSKNAFQYSVKEHIISPLIICPPVAIVCWLFDRRKAKKK
ncbi:MAG: hypothetical protein IKF36_06350 [Bacilli bacterium]|nr:hypothetical protein [Bacilli bacterium]